jgi:hypothetical protein
MAIAGSLSLVLLFFFLDGRAGCNADEASRLFAGDDDPMAGRRVC